MLLLAAAFVAVPARASVDLRVEARPISDPIQVFVTVTDSNGDPVGGLTAADFTLTLDGVSVPIAPSDLTLPPSQDPNQKVSVVFVMDYSSSVTNIARTAMESSVIAFIDAMNVGDYAAIIKFNDTNPERASVVAPFTAIGADNSALETAVVADYPGDGSPILDAVNIAVDQFAAPPVPLPAGPKAIILVTDGADNSSAITESATIAAANGNSIPIFVVGVGDLTIPSSVQLLTNLTTQTGGEFFPAPDDAEIAAAYASVQFLLTSEYLLTIQSTITDCAEHSLEVTVTGQPTASATFTRRECDTTPDAFNFTSQSGLNLDIGAKSNTVTITGLEGPATVDIKNGQYSIGCGAGSTFTSADGTIADFQTICVRHTTSAQFSTEKVTTLTVGGVSGTFTTTTRAEGNSGGGGGGATGAVELLLGLAALFARRRRLA
ncbi:MAG: VWA domain-containing protein [Steroidobacteraceae bacterium]